MTPRFFEGIIKNIRRSVERIRKRGGTMDNQETNLLTVEDVAALLKVEKQMIYKLKRDKKIPFVKIGGVIRFRRVDVNEWIESAVVR